MSAQKGSLLYIISEDLKTATQSTFDALAKSVKSVNETIEAGVNPEKSLKRKFEEDQEQQRVEDQKKEAERLQKEQEDQERQQVTMMIHPYTGAHMYLTGEQKEQFIRDLATMKPSDFGPVGTGSMGAGTPPIPPQGFPPRPPMGLGYGAMVHLWLLVILHDMFHPLLLRLDCLCFPSQLHLEGELRGSIWEDAILLDVCSDVGIVFLFSQSQISTACSFGSSLVWKERWTLSLRMLRHESLRHLTFGFEVLKESW